MPRRSTTLLLRFAPPLAILAFGAIVLSIDGCITHPANPSATQPATEIDLATTQPAFYLNQPPAAQVRAGGDYQRLWKVCQRIMRSALFELDREDYRDGMLSSKPMVSRQITEFWRPDTGTAMEAIRNSLTTMRRTLYIEFSLDPAGHYIITPKVLVERETILERRITDVSLYHSIFAGPMSTAKYSANVAHDFPVRYWTPVSRDTVMEKQVAAEIERAIAKSNLAIAPAATRRSAGTAPE